MWSKAKGQRFRGQIAEVNAVDANGVVEIEGFDPCNLTSNL